MSNFKNFTYEEARYAEEDTTVVGDIDHWAELYLETGQHLIDWQDRMAVMMERWRDEERRADGLLSSVDRADIR